MKKHWGFWTLAAALVVVGVWGIMQYQARRDWELQAENQYERAFSDLTYNIDSINRLTAKALVINSPGLVMKTFGDIWRHTFSCQQSLGQLPLTNVNLEKTEAFLSNLSAFTYRIAQKRVDGQLLSDSDWRILKNLKMQCNFLNNRLQKMQAKVLHERPQWLEMTRRLRAQAGIRKQNEPYKTNSFTKSFIMLEDGMKRFPSPSYAGSVLNFREKAAGLTGENISLADAAKVVRRFVGVNRLKNKRVDIVPRTKLPVPIYTVNIYPKNMRGGERINLDISRKGGHVLWMLSSHQPTNMNISIEEAEKLCLKDLAAKGFHNMALINRETVNNIHYCTFARRINDITIYPESIKMQVAADNGKIIGYEAMNYYAFKQDRYKLTPAISKSEAREKINKHIAVSAIDLAVILGDDFKQKLCYEVRGNLDKEKFLLFVNAVNGKDEKLSRITENGIQEEL